MLHNLTKTHSVSEDNCNSALEELDINQTGKNTKRRLRISSGPPLSVQANHFVRKIINMMQEGNEQLL